MKAPPPPYSQSLYEAPHHDLGPDLRSDIAQITRSEYPQQQNEDLEECVVCMARKPDIVLRCLVRESSAN